MEYWMPFHPKLVHFPVALFITAFAFDLLSLLFKKEGLHHAAFYLFIAAATTTPLVVWTGTLEAEKLHLNHPILDKHSLFAYWTLWLSLGSLPVLWLLKKMTHKYFRIVFFLVAAAIASLVAIASHHGGQMVYEYGVGISQ